MLIETQYSLWLIIVGLFLAIFFALLLYKGVERSFKPSILLVLKVLRFCSIFLLFFLLLKPLFLKYFTEVEHPTIAVLLDNSSSISQFVSKQKLVELTDEISSKLPGSYQVKMHVFDHELKDIDSLNLKGRQSNLSESISEVKGLYEHKNLSGLILLTDGIYTEGENPLYSDWDVQKPIYALGVGDSTPKKDFLIKKLWVNRTVQHNNEFFVDIDVQAYGLKQEQTKLKVLLNDSLVWQQAIRVESNNLFKTYRVKLKAVYESTLNIKAVLQQSTQEVNTQNNTKQVFVDVVKRKDKVALIASQVHPDISAIKQALESFDAIDLKIYDNDNQELDLQEVSSIIFYAPSKYHRADRLFNKIRTLNIPTWFILTQKQDFQIAKPFMNGHLSFQNLSDENLQVRPVLNSDFELFSFDHDLKQTINLYAPLLVNFGEYKISDQTQVLLYQKIGSVDSDYPMWFFASHMQAKHAFLLGQNIFRWPMSEYQKTESKQVFNGLIEKTVGYLNASSEDNQLTLEHSKVYATDQNVNIKAVLLDQSANLTTQPEVFLEVQHQNERSKFQMVAHQNYYNISLGRLAQGRYQIKANTKLGSKSISSQSVFNVQNIDVEAIDQVARHDMLKKLSKKTGGQFTNYTSEFDVSFFDALGDQKLKPKQKHKKEKRFLIDQLIWAFVIIATLISEWVIRRYHGIV